jgi:aryl carrier-like protein
MVKIKGYRIELDEVASVMQLFGNVKEASAIAAEVGADNNNTGGDGGSGAAAAAAAGGKMLVGFVTVENREVGLDLGELRRFVASKLPGYMVPAVILKLESMPLTTNAKIDKKALSLIPIHPNHHHDDDGLDPEKENRERESWTLTEKMMADVWVETLHLRHVSQIHRSSSFFALGGDSISVLKLKSALSKKSGGKDLVTVADIMSIPTLAELAKFYNDSKHAFGVDVSSSSSTTASSTTEPIGSGDVVSESDLRPEWGLAVSQVESVSKATPMQASMLVESVKVPSRYVLCKTWVLKGVGVLDVEESWMRLVRVHAALRTRFLSSGSDGFVQASLIYLLLLFLFFD